MSNHFSGDGNLGSEPQVRVFDSTDNQPPRAVLRLNVNYDSRIRNRTTGEFEDRGGFWANTDLFTNADHAHHLKTLFQEGMRVHVEGRLEQQSWKDKDTGEDRSRFVIIARSVSINTTRVEAVSLRPSANKQGQHSSSHATPNDASVAKNRPVPARSDDGEWDNPQDADEIPF
ncbi:single-stranded DNA-binding protein [Carnimonas bestiolae]|uniref:single-stranded DNA-binding protein n=1 Tax=Carnimonas bestiolae TaxID=3402172 RepID=UPI003EDB76A8